MPSYLLSRDASGKIHIEKLDIVLLNAPNTGAGPYDSLPSQEMIVALEASDIPLPSWEVRQEIRHRERYSPMSVRVLYRGKFPHSWARTQFHLAEVFLKIFR